MKKKEWSKKDRKILAGIVMLVALITVLLTGLVIFQIQKERGDIQNAIEEALQSGGFLGCPEMPAGYRS